MIHSLGYVAKIEMVGVSDQYTGAFAGSDNWGFIRAGFIKEPSDKSFQIGIGLKIMRSKVMSANTVAFKDPAGQSEFDFFK